MVKFSLSSIEGLLRLVTEDEHVQIDVGHIEPIRVQRDEHYHVA